MVELLVGLALVGLLVSWLAGYSPFFKSKLCRQEVESARLFIESLRAEALSRGEDQVPPHGGPSFHAKDVAGLSGREVLQDQVSGGEASGAADAPHSGPAGGAGKEIEPGPGFLIPFPGKANAYGQGGRGLFPENHGLPGEKGSPPTEPGLLSPREGHGQPLGKENPGPAEAKGDFPDLEGREEDFFRESRKGGKGRTAHPEDPPGRDIALTVQDAHPQDSHFRGRRGRG